MNKVKTLMKGVALPLAALALASTGHAAGQMLARLTPGTNAYTVGRNANVRLLDITVGSPFALYEVYNNENLEAAELRVKAQPGVVWAEDEHEVSDPESQSGSRGGTVGVIGGRSDLYVRNTNMLGQISFDPVRSLVSGRTVRIAILDTGISPVRLDLWARVYTSKNFVEPGARAYDLPLNTDSNGNGIVDEGFGHGTFVTGLVDQIAPKCPIVAVRVADSDGHSSIWRLVKGLAFAQTTGCEVVNISMGSVVSLAGLDDVIEYYKGLGMTVVAPAGNNKGRSINYPSRYSSVICVTGVDYRDKKPLFANFGSAVEGCAPAAGLYSQWPDGTMGTWSGTSFASPLVAAGVADCLRRRAKAYPDDIKNAVEDSGSNIDALNPSYTGQLGTRLNLTSLNTAMLNLPIRP